MVACRVHSLPACVGTNGPDLLWELGDRHTGTRTAISDIDTIVPVVVVRPLRRGQSCALPRLGSVRCRSCHVPQRMVSKGDVAAESVSTQSIDSAVVSSVGAGKWGKLALAAHCGRSGRAWESIRTVERSGLLPHE